MICCGSSAGGGTSDHPAVSNLPRRPGRPPCCSRVLAVRIIQLRQAGLSYAQICTALNAEQIPTPMGGSRWLKSHVDRLLHTRYVLSIIEEMREG
jgi:hypothetical protein